MSIMADKSEVYVAQIIISGHEIGKTFAPVESRGFHSWRSLAYVNSDDLDSFFPSPDKL